MARRELNILGKCIKKTKKKVKKQKAANAKMRDELTQWRSLAENHNKDIVQIRESVHQLKLVAEWHDAQVNEVISAWLAQNGGD